MTVRLIRAALIAATIALAPGLAACSVGMAASGDEPSAGRAVGHAALDVLTLGLWEVIGTPIEMVQGRSYHAVVTYTTEGTVETVETNGGGASSW